MTQKGQHSSLILQSLRKALPATWKSASWLLRLMIPISLGVTLLQYFGVLELFAKVLHPVFVHIGLPGASSLAFISGAAAGTYAGIAAMMSMPLSLRQATIIALMIALCHALPMECAVNRKTGSSFWKMGLIRIVMAFLSAALLNLLLPEMQQSYVYLGVDTQCSWREMLLTWALSQLKMAAMVFAIIYTLMVLQRLLEAYDLMKPISDFLSPLMKIFGLPRNAAYMWLVGNVIGISYGSAVMLELEEQGKITREEANEANYHLIMNHSLLEDTIVFAVTGISALILITVRISFAILLVWSRKALKASLRTLKSNATV